MISLGETMLWAIALTIGFAYTASWGGTDTEAIGHGPTKEKGNRITTESIHEIPIEAEHMDIIKGWTVEGGSYFNGQPNLWSGARLTADASDEEAIAEKEIYIPAAGRYLLWVHYESAYGFGSVFKAAYPTIQGTGHHLVSKRDELGARRASELPRPSDGLI